MIWVTWRQHRREVAISLAVVAVTALFMAFQWSQMVAAVDRLRLASCQSGDPSCNQALSSYMDQFFGLSVMVRYFLTALPAVLGVFVTAPLISREVEEGTHMFIWTQSITRSRWMTTKLVLFSVFTLVLAGLLSPLVSWWQQPLDRMYANSSWTFFDVIGAVPVAYALFALTLGVALSAVVQRTVPAMAATLVLFAATRVAVYLWRPHFLPPLTMHLPAPSTALMGIWQIGTTSYGQTSETIVYQPAERFWTFQYFESGIFLVLSCLLLVVTAIWLRHRIR